MKLSRRQVLLGSAGAAALGVMGVPKAAKANTNGTIPGAIRWDAWYGTGPTGNAEAFVNPAVSQNLGPSYFQYKAPWFSTPVSSYLMSINGNTQATMDAEIGYAVTAGLKYWAFLWYGQQTPASAFMNAWNLYQSSSIKSQINWSLIFQLSRLGGTSVFNSNIATYVSYMAQSTYQTVISGRPLLYILWDISTYGPWGGSISGVQTAFNALRTACTTAGLGNPYIVVLSGAPSSAFSLMTSVSGDAISSYSVGSWSVATPFPTFETSVEADWAARAALAPIVPNPQVGADSRARKETTFQLAVGKNHVNQDVYTIAPTGSQLTAEMTDCVNYILANPSLVPSKAMLIYSWDEMDEYGGMMPRYNAANPSTPDTTFITAMSQVAF